MKRKNIKTLYKVSILLIVIIAGLISVTNNRISVFACDSNNEIIANDEIEGITSMSNEAYLSVHYSDGTMGMIVDETIDSDEATINSINNEDIQKTTVISSGRPDSESIVAVFFVRRIYFGRARCFFR